MINVVLAVESRDIRSAQRLATLVAEEVESPEIVGFAKRILSVSGIVFGGEEL